MSDKFTITESELFSQKLNTLPDRRLLVNTLNAYCYNLAQRDSDYANALRKSDILLPDGVSIVFASYFLSGKKLVKIAGADLFFYEMNRLNRDGGSCFFLGSSEDTLQRIVDRSGVDFPNVKVQTFSPPFKAEFSAEDNMLMLDAVNAVKPDVLFVGMTAPKQEKWAAKHFEELNVKHICCIGAVFDFYAGTVNRAPDLVINLGLEWFYRLVKEPGRMWRRYLLGNPEFLWLVIKEKLL